VVSGSITSARPPPTLPPCRPSPFWPALVAESHRRDALVVPVSGPLGQAVEFHDSGGRRASSTVRWLSRRRAPGRRCGTEGRRRGGAPVTPCRTRSGGRRRSDRGRVEEARGCGGRRGSKAVGEGGGRAGGLVWVGGGAATGEEESSQRWWAAALHISH
jgi:hypothetical protein